MKHIDILFKLGEPHSGPRTLAALRCRPRIKVRPDGSVSGITIHGSGLDLDEDAMNAMGALLFSSAPFPAMFGTRDLGYFYGQFQIWSLDLFLDRPEFIKLTARSLGEVRYLPCE